MFSSGSIISFLNSVTKIIKNNKLNIDNIESSEILIKELESDLNVNIDDLSKDDTIKKFSEFSEKDLIVDDLNENIRQKVDKFLMINKKSGNLYDRKMLKIDKFIKSDLILTLNRYGWNTDADNVNNETIIIDGGFRGWTSFFRYIDDIVLVLSLNYYINITDEINIRLDAFNKDDFEELYNSGNDDDRYDIVPLIEISPENNNFEFDISNITLDNLEDILSKLNDWIDDKKYLKEIEEY